ncbi:MAG TPA: cytochrome b/b6 domain-containing protein [Rubrivivax sp.]
MRAAQSPAPSGAPGAAPARVWDLPTRLFHWVLAATVLCSVVSAKIGGNAMVWHFRFGYVVFTLLAFRVIWGLVGGHWSRFSSFLHAPSALLRYVRGEHGPDEHLEVGHSPTGALSVFALLALLALQVATGLIADDEIASRGPLNRLVSGETASQATGWHESWGQNLILAVIALHIAAIVYYLVRKNQNLIGPMIHGDKHLPPSAPVSADGGGRRLLALALLAACAGVVTYVVRLGG